MFFINAVLTFFFLYPLFFLLLQHEKWFKYVFLIKKFWAHLIIIPLGIFYRIQRSEDLKKDQAYVVCPNHTSYLDIMLIYIAVPFYFHTMGKAELLKVPLFRKFFERMNIPVNRKSRVDSHRAMLRAASDLDKGVSVTLFPEGTIYHNGPVMGRFKNGPFHLAIEKQVPILPVTFMNNWLLLPDDFQQRVGRPGVADVIIHPPIPTTGMTMDDLDRLKQMTYDVINAPLYQKYQDWYPVK
ncbi:MAG: lysophospholipid acyltransferase family protein [Bacteroidota bacterium]